MAKLLRFPLILTTLLALFAAMLALGGPASGADRSLLYRAQMDPLVPAARLLTHLGDWWFVLILGSLGTAWLAFRRQWRAAALLALLVVSERLVVETLKLVLDRARPDPAGHLTAVHSMAFPSGHAANAMVLGLAVALLATKAGRVRKAAIALALLYALLVGLTRLVLGVHWPSDVLGGWALGAAWTLLLVRPFGGTSASEQH